MVVVEFYSLGLNDDEIIGLLDVNPNIRNMDDNDINNSIMFLKKLGCEDRHIKNIIITNPNYFDRNISDLFNLVMVLNEIGVSHLELLFDSNPYFLNNDDFEVREFVNMMFNRGYDMDYIVDLISDNPYIDILN